MLKALKIRLYPTVKQQNLLNRHFGCTRFVYNRALDFKITEYNRDKTKYSKFDMIKWSTAIRSNPEFPWLAKCKAEVLQNTIDGLDSAFTNFFRGNGFPKFKKKSNIQSFTSKQNLYVLHKDQRLKFYKEKIKFSTSDKYLQQLADKRITLKQITYSRDTCGHYYASILVETNTQHIEDRSNITSEIGVDLGLKSFLITSTGETVENPRFLKKSTAKLAKLQRSHSRKTKGSANREKSRLALAKAHKKVTNQRNHFIHQITNKLLNENQVIALETLKVKNMMKNHKLAKSIADVSWYSFTSTLEYKAKWRGVEIRRIGAFVPSSKTCSCCGSIKEDLTLSDRTYECTNCGLSIDRDENAAINILNFSKVDLTKFKKTKIGRNYPEFTLQDRSGYSLVECRREIMNQAVHETL